LNRQVETWLYLQIQSNVAGPR